MESWSIFARLGEGIERDWHAASRDERAFPDIAARHLASDALSGLALKPLVEQLLGDRPLPAQAHVEEVFGQPPVTVHAGDGFFVELLFWSDALLSIHRHRFGGAFRVVVGSSLHCRYRFHERRRVCSSLLLGELEPTEAELLRTGDVRAIGAGDALIHATYHLERPSVTLIARTRNEWAMGPPYDYRPPGIALDPTFESAALKKRLQLLALLHGTQPELYARMLDQRLDREDLFGTYLLLEQLWSREPDPALRRAATERAEARFGAPIALMRRTFEEQDRLRRLLHLRRRVEDPQQAYFLAVLANVRGARDVLALVRARVADADPVEVTMRWLHQLEGEANVAIFGRGGDPAWAERTRRLLAGQPIAEEREVRAALAKTTVLGSLFPSEEEVRA